MEYTIWSSIMRSRYEHHLSNQSNNSGGSLTWCRSFDYHLYNSTCFLSPFRNSFVGCWQSHLPLRIATVASFYWLVLEYYRFNGTAEQWTSTLLLGDGIKYCSPQKDSASWPIAWSFPHQLSLHHLPLRWCKRRTPRLWTFASYISTVIVAPQPRQ